MKHSFSRARVLSNNGDRALIECADDEFISITRGHIGSGFENLFADEFLKLLPVGRTFPIRLHLAGKKKVSACHCGNGLKRRRRPRRKRRRDAQFTLVNEGPDLADMTGG